MMVPLYDGEFMKPKILPLLLLAGALTVMGCATYPGGFNNAFAEQWGCDYDQVVEEMGEYRSGATFTPQVGWTACDVLAHVGGPADVNRQQSEQGQSATWWYRDYGSSGGARMVTLELRGGHWIVDYVSW